MTSVEESSIQAKDTKVFGKKWSSSEEDQLLSELEKNMTVDIIAQLHERTVGGITTRIKEIAYKLFKSKVSVDEIIKKTKLSEQEILDFVNKKELSTEKKSQNKSLSKSKKSGGDLSLQAELAIINKNIEKLSSLVQSLVKNK